MKKQNAFQIELDSALKGNLKPTWKSKYITTIQEFADWIEMKFPNITTKIQRNITNPVTYLYARSLLSAESMTSILVFKESPEGITILNRPNVVEGEHGTTYSTKKDLKACLLEITSDAQFATQLKLINEVHSTQIEFEGYIHTNDFFEMSSNDLKIIVQKDDVLKFGASQVGKVFKIKVANRRDMFYQCKFFNPANIKRYRYFEVNGFLGIVEDITELEKVQSTLYLNVKVSKFSTENKSN